MKRLLIIGALAFAGCTSDLARFSVYAPDGIDLTSGNYEIDTSRRLKGVDPAEIYVVYPTSTPSYDQTVRNAIKQLPGCVGLADVRLKRKAFWLLYGYCNFECEGYPIVTKGTAAKGKASTKATKGGAK